MITVIFSKTNYNEILPILKVIHIKLEQSISEKMAI